MIYVIIAAILILIILFCYYQNNKIDITEYEIENSDINSDIKIAHLSDLHSKPFHNAVKKLKEIQPDMIMITGDYINDHGKNKEKMFEIGKDLLNISPVFYITGNHERRLDYFENLMKELKKLGFTVLLNDISEEIIKDNPITVLGLDENQASFEDYKARKNGTFVYKDMKPYFEKLESCGGF
ncbi:MAG: metallophosphoesterase [Eubacterium sp.]|nr:metallophosphoesterase [Eubacterium sp.]